MSRKSFWKTDNGKILSHTIHEHNSGIRIIVNYNNLLKRLLEHKLITFTNLDSEELFIKSIEGIEKGKIRSKEGIDYCYTKFKEKENE